MNTPLPETLFATRQIQHAWHCIQIVHNMYFDKQAQKQGLLIFGESGQGKTFLLSQYRKQFASKQLEANKTIPILYCQIERKAKNSDEIPRLLINAMGLNPPDRRNVNSLAIQNQLVRLLKEHQVELIMLDEIQNLNTSYDGIEFQGIIKYFCALLDREDIACSIVFAGSMDAQRIMNFGSKDKRSSDNEHLSRRMLKPIELSSMIPNSQQWLDCITWFFRYSACPAISLEEHRIIFERLYLVYEARAMSSLRDLFKRDNVKQAKTLNELLVAFQENCHLYGKSPLNLFTDGEITDDQVQQSIKRIAQQLFRIKTLANTKAYAAL